jgi:2'-5' RNA ligase
MRNFIAIHSPERMKAYIHTLLLELKRINPLANITYVEPSILHCTLLFLGEVEEDTLDSLSNDIEEQLDFKPFDIELARYVCLPNCDDPQTVAIELKQSAELSRIHTVLKDIALSHKIHVPQRAFKPHITLGRIKDFSKNLKIGKQLVPQTFTVNSIDLMASTLTMNGPHYTLIKAFA